MLAKMQICLCGCCGFWIMIRNDGKFLLKCKKCKAERVVTTPGVRVERYDVSIPFGILEEE